MTSDSEDALSWEGDEEPSARRPALPSGWKAVGRGHEDVGRIDADGTVVEPDAPSGMGTGMLLLTGILGGVYLLYTVGWVIGGLRLRPLANFIVADGMYLPYLVLAIAAPALWMLAGWVLTRGRAAWIRVLVLLGGVVLLVPWPFVMLGAVGA